MRWSFAHFGCFSKSVVSDWNQILWYYPALMCVQFKGILCQSAKHLNTNMLFVKCNTNSPDRHVSNSFHLFAPRMKSEKPLTLSVCAGERESRDHTLISSCLNMVTVYLRRLETSVSPGNHDTAVCVSGGLFNIVRRRLSERAEQRAAYSKCCCQNDCLHENSWWN